MNYQAINFKDKFAKFDNHWSPRVIAKMNRYTQVTSRYEFQSRWALAMQGGLAKQCRLPCEAG